MARVLEKRTARLRPFPPCALPCVSGDPVARRVRQQVSHARSSHFPVTFPFLRRVFDSPVGWTFIPHNWVEQQGTSYVLRRERSRSSGSVPGLFSFFFSFSGFGIFFTCFAGFPYPGLGFSLLWFPGTEVTRKRSGQGPTWLTYRARRRFRRMARCPLMCLRSTLVKVTSPGWSLATERRYI